MSTAALQDLTELGLSVWLDDLNRSRLTTGNLADLVKSRCVRGVTTNPAIFDKAIRAGATDYAADISRLARTGANAETVVRELTTADVRAACDVLHEVWIATNGVDGRVSIEVDPRLARNASATIEQAQSLWREVDRPNVLIKIPATPEGLPAITEVTALGISVNVTLIFSVERYQEVMSAFASGLSKALTAGIDLTHIHSVASFFVSRVDTETDRQLEEIGSHEALDLRGRAAIANVRLAWHAYENFVSSREWEALSAHGANVQRPLWASTGVKNPLYSDTRYVMDIAGSGCVNTMPEATLEAVHDHGQFRGDTLSGSHLVSAEVFSALSDIGVEISQVCDVLEQEGVDSFIAAWENLLTNVETVIAES
jgi:transaldolase